MRSAESSVWKRAAQSLGAHLRALEAIRRKLQSERRRIAPHDIASQIMTDVAIRRIERDLLTVQGRLDNPA